MPAIISKSKLEEMIGMGILDAEMLGAYSMTFFESTRSDSHEIMVNISEQVESEIVPVDVERTIVSTETVRQLRAMGLIKEEKLNNKEITLSKFPSKFGSDTELIAFAKATANGLDDLLAKPAETHAEMANDGTLDLDATEPVDAEEVAEGGAQAY